MTDSATEADGLEHAVAKGVKTEGLESIASTVEERLGLPEGDVAYHGPSDVEWCPAELDYWHFHAVIVSDASQEKIIEEIVNEHGDRALEFCDVRPEDGLFVYHDFDAAIKAEWSVDKDVEENAEMYEALAGDDGE